MRKAIIRKLTEDGLFDSEFLRGDYRLHRSHTTGATQVEFIEAFDPYRPGDVAGLSSGSATYLVETLGVARSA